MEAVPWAETRRPLLARLTGGAAVLLVVLILLPGSLGGPLFEDVSTPRLLDWVKAHATGLPVDGFLGAVGATVAALVLLSLLALARGRGLPGTVAATSAAAFLAVNWVHAGVYFALADAGGRQSADAGIVGLFSLTKGLTFADGFPFGVTLLIVSVHALRSRALPAALGWLGIGVAVVHLVSLPVQFAINGRADGITGPIGVVLVLVWFLAVGLVLMIRPVPSRRPDRAAVPVA